jgi:hypothetical protein
VSLPFQFDAARAYSSTLRAEEAPPATTATTATNSSFVAKVADVAALASAKYEDRAKNAAEVAVVAGGLDQAATEPVLHVDEAEREAIAIELGGVPIIYASEFARLQAHPPAEVPRDRWDQFINDAGLFLDRWGRQAEALGWRPDELFGLHPDAPMARYDRMGLIWMLRGEAVLDISETAAKLSGGLTFYRKAIAARERQNKEDCNIQQQYSQ